MSVLIVESIGRILPETKKPLTGLNGKWLIFLVEMARELSNQLEEDLKRLLLLSKGLP